MQTKHGAHMLQFTSVGDQSTKKSQDQIFDVILTNGPNLQEQGCIPEPLGQCERQVHPSCGNWCQC